jgi:vanillate/3-O-methylgallate O-demethylase
MGAIRFAPPLFTGSVDPSNARARFRTPTEVGWEKSVRFDHEFMGRKALEKEHASPKRTIVTLVWNSKDVIDIYASLFEQGEDYKYIELPSSPHLRGVLAHADHVLKDGETVGVSSGTVYSYYFRQMISLCTIDLGAAKIGTEVVLQWGDFGKKLKEVRATVARFPYLNADRNQTVNVAKVS